MYKYLKIRNDGSHRPLKGIYQRNKVNTLKESNIRVSKTLHYRYSIDLGSADVPLVVRSHLAGPLSLSIIAKPINRREDRLYAMASDAIKLDTVFPLAAADRDTIIWSNVPPDTNTIYI